jgi:DNA-binding MarR family transcriptional regulator
MKFKRYIVQTKEENKKYTNFSSFDTLKDAEIVKKLVERQRAIKVRILDRQTKNYYM